MSCPRRTWSGGFIRCTGSGLGISLFTDRTTAHVGEQICYSALVFNTPFPACLAENVVAGIVTPDGVTNRITLRRSTLNPGDSDFYTNVVCYIVRAQDVILPKSWTGGLEGDKSE